MSVFASGDSGTLKRIDNGTEKWSIDINAYDDIGGLSLGHNGKHIYVATGEGNTLEKYDIHGNGEWSVDLPAPVNDVSVGPNGSWVYIAVGNEGSDYRSFEQRSVDDGSQGWKITPDIMGGLGIEAGPNGNYTYGFTDAGSIGGGTTQEIYKLDANNGETQVVRSVPDSVEDLVATPDGQYIFFNADGNDLYKANASDLTDVWTIQEVANIMGLSMGKDGNWLYLCHNRYGGVAKKSVADGTEDWLYEGHDDGGVYGSYDVSAHDFVYSAGVVGDLKQLLISDGTEGWTYNFEHTVNNVVAYPVEIITQSDSAASISSIASILASADSVAGSTVENIAGYTLYSANTSFTSGGNITSGQIVLGPSNNIVLSQQSVYEVIPLQARSLAGSSSGSTNIYRDYKIISRNIMKSAVGQKTLEEIESKVQSFLLGIHSEGTLYIWTKYEVINSEVIYEIIERETSDIEYESLEEEDNMTQI